MNFRIQLSRACFIVLFCIACCWPVLAQQAPDLSNSQMPSVVTVPEAAKASDHFDVDAATNAYLAEIPAAARARSDAYFEGGYWLILWDFLMSVVVYWILLRFGWSARMRHFAERVTGSRFLQPFIYWFQFMIITSVLEFPLAVYEGYFREWKYGLATQTFGPWLWDQTKGLLLGIILGGIVVMILMWIVRKLTQYLAYLGRCDHDDIDGSGRHDRSRRDHADVQHTEDSGRRKGDGAHFVAGARQRNLCERRLSD